MSIDNRVIRLLVAAITVVFLCAAAAKADDMRVQSYVIAGYRVSSASGEVLLDFSLSNPVVAKLVSDIQVATGSNCEAAVFFRLFCLSSLSDSLVQFAHPALGKNSLVYDIRQKLFYFQDDSIEGSGEGGI